MITKDDMIYNLSAHHIFDKGSQISVNLLQKGDFLYRMKPGKNYKVHIALIVEPLKDGKIKIYDASPEHGVSQRYITVTRDADFNFVSKRESGTDFNLVGGTNMFLSLEVDKFTEGK